MRALLVVALLSNAVPALANHPEGEQLEEVTAAREPAFEPTDGVLPEAWLRTVDDGEFELQDLSDRVVVLSFVPEKCGTSCAKQQQLLKEVQAELNVTPMRNMVTFVTVAPPWIPVLGGWDAANWRRATPAGNATTTGLAAELEGAESSQDAPAVHIINRGARRAGIFRGVQFRPISMVLYINGLTNSHSHEDSLFERIMRWLR